MQGKLLSCVVLPHLRGDFLEPSHTNNAKSFQPGQKKKKIEVWRILDFSDCSEPGRIRKGSVGGGGEIPESTVEVSDKSRACRRVLWGKVKRLQRLRRVGSVSIFYSSSWHC